MTSSIGGRERIDRYWASFRMIWANRRSRVGVGILVFFLLLSIAGPTVLPMPRSNPSKNFLLPSLEHPLGTDGQGQDILATLAYGGGFILSLSFVAAFLSTTIGAIVGISSAFFSGKTDRMMTGVTDVSLTIPGLILVIVLSQFIKATDAVTIGAMLSIVGWASFARTIRSQILVLRTQPFIETAKMLRLPARHIIFAELLPNVLPYVAINFIFYFEVALFTSVGLYYLGVLPYNRLNWGTMINQSFAQGAYLRIAGLSSLISPLAAVTLLAVGLILLSGGFEEVFNPRLRRA